MLLIKAREEYSFTPVLCPSYTWTSSTLKSLKLTNDVLFLIWNGLSIYPYEQNLNWTSLKDSHDRYPNILNIQKS